MSSQPTHPKTVYFLTRVQRNAAKNEFLAARKHLKDAIEVLAEDPGQSQVADLVALATELQRAHSAVAAFNVALDLISETFDR